MRKAVSIAATAVLLVIVSCSGSIKPVDIEKGDMCSFCRMAISEKKFAAQIITDEETALKFDDIGCLLRYRAAGGEQPKAAAVYVADSRSGGWLKAEDAFFVRSGSVKTPMGSGIIAFDSTEAAGPGAVRFAQLEGQ
jgi:copper chaperone NosL